MLSIELREHSVWQGELDLHDFDFLHQHFRNQFDLGYGPTSGIYRINPKQFVGVLVLPSGRRIEIRPKIPITSIFYLLSEVTGIRSPFRDEEVRFDRFDDILEFLAMHLADVVQTTLQ